LRPGRIPWHPCRPVETTESPLRPRLDRWLNRALPYAPVAVATLWLARTTTRNILAKAGEPAVPLDDAYIHFQYARALAEGRFFAFLPGDGYTSGATSLLWPAMLAPFYLVGFRDTAIIWAAWFWGWLFLALLAVEVKRLAAPLVGEMGAIGAATITLSFGGYTWFAASGMEVTPLAYTLALSARLGAAWAERPDARTPALRNRLLAVAVLGPLVRPEGMVASALVLAVLALWGPPGDGSLRARLAGRAWALGALVGPLLPPLINRVLTGHFSTTTTQVKWMGLNPYYGGPNFWSSTRNNLATFFTYLLDGREWSAIFIPAGAFPVAIGSFVAILYAGARSGRWARAALVLLLAAGMALPTTYVSFLWNRLRYLWPFAFAWCIGLACLARAVADLAASIRPRYAAVGSVLAGIGAGLLGHHLPWTIDDVAQSASAIHRQQVYLGRWAREKLPAGSRIGVNDTGAIAYFSGHRVFDVVGLTTPEEARYWVAGSGSRYEHYERLHRQDPSRLPTHFIVYPHWMACDVVLGRELTRATVTDQSILGGVTMIAHEARYDRLHRGDHPERAVPGKLVDELDVSDLESEEAHRYDVAVGGGTEQDNLVRSTVTDLGIEKYDGGRGKRTRDRFRLRLPAGKGTLVARWGALSGASLSVRIDEREVERVEVEPGSWSEHEVAVTSGGGEALVEVIPADGRGFTSMHYWVYEAGR
jgi:hypothetical protein